MMCGCDSMMGSALRCGCVLERREFGDEKSKPVAGVPTMYMNSGLRSLPRGAETETCFLSL